MITLTTRLPDDLEREFRAHYLQRFLNHMRAMWALGVLLWVGGALADPALFPEVAAELRVVRIAVTLVVVAVVASLYIPAVVRGPVHLVTMVGTAAVGYGSVALVGITGFPGAMMHFMTAIVVTIVATCFVTVLRVEYTIASCLSIVGVYALTVFWLAPAPTVIAARTSFAILGTTLVGLMVTYVVEQYARENFAQRRALEASEKEAREAREEAIRASQAKSVFLSNMSHELRTPLNAVIGFAQLLERSAAMPEKERESVTIIKSSGEYLLELINDVLAISKIEAGKVALSEMPFDLRRMLRGVVEMIRVRTDGKGLQLVVDVPDDLPERVVGDEGKLRQVLVNLLGNAVKFTEEGGVALRARWDERDGGVASFEVEDTGYGIAEDEVGRLFEAFAQTESGRASKEGTGLGLAISQNFVALMGGRIRVRSVLGKGSVFAFDVALPEGLEETAEQSAARVVGLEPGQPARRILCVDDMAENRALIDELLRGVGFDVRMATNGQEAVDLWASWRPHLIWMDLRMPVMDGVAATRLIREREGAGERCVILALTASAFEHDREAILSSGFDGFVTKPYREESIFDAVAEHLGVAYRYERPKAADAPAAARPALASERLATLPTELLARLEEALLIGDVSASNEAAAGVHSLDPELGADLRRAVREYRFDEILGLLGRTT
jgi:signal transduction histidine kinase/DNA-binding NarL/FixJ family response regulator